jgi:hypothetical protein
MSMPSKNEDPPQRPCSRSGERRDARPRRPLTKAAKRGAVRIDGPDLPALCPSPVVIVPDPLPPINDA